MLNTSVHGFHHLPHDRTAFEDPEEERQEFYEKMWNSPGFTKLTSNYLDLLSNPEVNAEWCDFIAGKIRRRRRGPRDSRAPRSRRTTASGRSGRHS